MKSHLLISAASSGSGKTTFAIGLLRALKNRSLSVQPFKCGPDYIDTWHHRMAAGRPSINLDGFMMSEEHIHSLYVRYTSDIDVAVTEGVMGLFDGYDGMQGSSATISETLKMPVILIVNAKNSAYSVAPLLYGFKHFRENINIVGAVFNFVASDNHYSYLKQACQDAGVEALGYLPEHADVEIPSRHLGLSLDDNFCFEEFADRIAALVERYVNIDRLLETTNQYTPPSMAGGTVLKMKKTALRIAIARDSAFNFTYEENIQLLHRLGIVTYFSPIKDTCLPESDFVYLPGGYPELYLSELSSNHTMLQSIKDYIEAGGKLLAECGGMMYLCKDIIGTEGHLRYPMVNILPQSATMEKMKLNLGYRSLLYDGQILKGHEFHYSHITSSDHPLPSAGEAYTAKGVRVDTPLYCYKNVLAGYTHLYWADESRNEWFMRYLYNL